MRFYVRKRRATPTVIIVALIDVLVVLVIFLLVTTTFKQQQYNVKLAESSQGQKTGANENPPLVVAIDANPTNRIYYLGNNKDPVTIDQLADHLREAVAKNPDVTVEINADKNAPWGKVVKVRDAVVEAKIKKLVANIKEEPKP
ncbi:MAG TPA: biopolymer transporter ExbD [Verrucomicrobiae bacterium]|nr:biopolymer transporter ExbD [Verrucomicrobiae bacterium]